MSGRARRICSSISLARACASSRRLVPSRPSVRKATRPPSVRRKRSSRGSAPVASLTIAPDDGLRRRRAPRCAALRLGQRLEMRLHAGDLGHGGTDRRLELLGDRVRLVERQLARQLDVQRELGVAVDVDERDVVHLADVRDRERRCVRTLAHVASSIGSTCTTTSAFGSAPLDRGLDRVGGGVALADRGASARRRSRRPRTGARPPGACAAGAARPTARSARIAAARRCSASAGARSISTSTLSAHQPRSPRAITSTPTNSAAIESPSAYPARATSSPTSTASEPARSLPKCSAFEASAALP